MNRSSRASQARSHLGSVPLNGYTRSITELHWLLLILVILYYLLPTGPLEEPDNLLGSMIGYAGFVLLFRYSRTRGRDTRLKLAVETWGMIVFITLALTHTGYYQSPLLNLYLLVIIACALTLGMIMTLLEVILIASCYLLVGYSRFSVDLFAPDHLSTLVARFSPVLLVAYVTSMLTSDILSARRRIGELVRTDDLTGLLNLQSFLLLLDRELEHARQYREPFIVLMIDLDELGNVNGRYGHDTGTQLIRNVAATLRDSVRSSDIVARYGSDRFAVLVPRIGSAHATRCADRIRRAISNTSVGVNGSRVAVTASIGIAGYPDTVDKPERVLELAEQALHCSRQVGRNLVTWYDRVLEAPPEKLSHAHPATRQCA